MSVKPSFVGDPRYGSAIKISREEYLRIKNNKWITTNTLDFILQGGLCHSNGDPYKTEVFLGSLSSLTTFDSANANEGDTTSSKARMSRMKTTMKTFQKGNKTIVIPQHSHSHFIVLVVHTKEELIKSIECYDSLRKSTRGRNITQHKLKPQVEGFVLSIQKFWKKYVHPNIPAEKNKNGSQEEEEVLPIVTYMPCPQQNNLYDCGLFATAICLHLLDGVIIKENTFSQDNISALRLNIGKTMEGWLEKNTITDLKQKNPFLGLDCLEVRSHFDTLKDIRVAALPEQIRHNKKNVLPSSPSVQDLKISSLPEQIHHNKQDFLPSSHSSDESKIASLPELIHHNQKKVSPSSPSIEESISTQHNDQMKTTKIDYQRTTTTTTSTSESKVGDGKNQSIITTRSEVTSKRLTLTGGELKQDKHIIKMIEEHSDFLDLDAVTSFVENYEAISGFRLKVQKSSVDRGHRVYICKVHMDCPF